MIALVLPRDYRLSRTLFHFWNCAVCSFAVGPQFQRQVLTLDLTEGLVAMGRSLGAGLSGSVAVVRSLYISRRGLVTLG